LTPHERQKLHSRYAKRFYNSLTCRQRCMRSRCVPRKALHDPQFSAWRKIISSNNDQSLITMTGFNHQTFEWLNNLFEPYYSSHSPHVDANGSIVPIPCQGYGRPRLMSAADCLGLCLAWTRTTGPLFLLQVVFGMTRTSCSVYLRFGRRLLIHILHNNEYAKIAIPTIKKYINTKTWCTYVTHY
jgi:hypothetical protein